MNDVTQKSLSNILDKYNKLSKSLETLSFEADSSKITQIKKTLSEYEEIVNKYKYYLELKKEYKDNLEIIETEKDPEFLELAKKEANFVSEKIEKCENDIQVLLIPKDERDKKNVIIEIRGAAGGNEANIFVGDLFKMYCKYANYNNWKIEILNSIESESGGFSQIEFLVIGKNVFSKLKYESGVHRVQRVPKTENKGRVHTSTVTVAIIPEAKDIDIKISPSDLRIDTYRASGAGGQHVNKTDSAVRITHISTGTVSASQDGRSQHSNKETALKLLKSKLYNQEYEKSLRETNDYRSKAVGSGSRSEKIRTYNYPQNRITDHRIGLTLNKLDFILNNDRGLEEIILPLITFFQNKQINEFK